jgi:TetR/AcrR family transcriptional regulator, cholesterol catabolism regulator
MYSFMSKLISKPATRRERSKQDKLERIKEAAEHLFRERGYEATTVRDISDKADVAVGTIFLYFKDKSDLLIKLYDKALEKTWQTVLEEEPRDTLLENLLTAFTKLLAFHARDSRLAITYLKEVLSHDASQGWSEGLNRFLEHLTSLVQQGQDRGEVRRGANALQAARNFFALYYAALTGMLSGSLTADMTVQHFLKPALELQLDGLLEKGGKV